MHRPFHTPRALPDWTTVFDANRLSGGQLIGLQLLFKQCPLNPSGTLIIEVEPLVYPSDETTSNIAVRQLTRNASSLELWLAKHIPQGHSDLSTIGSDDDFDPIDVSNLVRIVSPS